ncbi:MAG: hypothetical protein ABI771_08350 [Betaproteobacteria bacterium]
MGSELKSGAGLQNCQKELLVVPSLMSIRGHVSRLGEVNPNAVTEKFHEIHDADDSRRLSRQQEARPGICAAHKEVSWLNRFPEARKKIVGVVQLDHLGELDYSEVDGHVEATGLNEQSYLWVRNNPLHIDATITAVKSHGWRRAQVVAPERPGIHGGRQELCWGIGVNASRSTPYGCDVWHCLDVPAFGLGGFPGNYYTIHSGIDRWDVRQFLAQTATMTELTGFLMTADLKKIRPKLGERYAVCRPGRRSPACLAIADPA